MILAGVSALAALLLAYLLGAAWPGLAAAGILLAAGLATRRLLQILLWLAFAVVATASLTTLAPAALHMAGAAVVAVFAITPLIVTLGEGAPPRRFLVAPLVAALVAFVFFLTPPGAALFSSDLAVGAIIVALASGLVLASSFYSVTPR